MTNYHFLRKWLLILPPGLLLLGLLHPVNCRESRLAAAAGVGACLLLLLWICRRRKWFFFSVSGLSLLFLLFLAMPARRVDHIALRERYLEELKSFEGTVYLWGGEGKLGIDCSGLPRKALRNAMIHRGLVTFDGALIRKALLQWHFDAGARSLQNGFRNDVTTTGIQGSVRRLSGEPQPGDLAITDDGTHVMVFLEDGWWIQAAPDAGAVRIERPEESGSPWFDRPATIFRWTLLIPPEEDHRKSAESSFCTLPPACD